MNKRGLLLLGAFAAACIYLSMPVMAAEVILDETTFRVDGTRGHLTRQLIVRVDGPEDRGYGRMVLGYDTFRSIRSFSGQITDADGRRIKRLHRDDIIDRPGSDGISIYTDDRRQSAELYHDSYPYFVEWEYEIRYETLLIWPSWYPQRERDRVRQARLTVDIPDNFDLRYHTQWLDMEPQEEVRRGRRVLSWSLASLPTRPQEPFGPDQRYQGRAVHFAAGQFRTGRWAGSLSSWQDFGTWYHALWSGHGELPQEAREEVRRLVADVEDPRERARRVYQLVQRQTRYVSVQLGIGGWQPFDAEYVYTRRYGDCKALTNYLQALLLEAGIESYPALIGAGRPDLNPDFPYNGFNHVILYVPFEGGEPLWLEATSGHLPFGQLGPETENRYALVVTPEGGELLRTSISPAEQNYENRRVDATLHSDGSVRMSVTTSFTGHAVGTMRYLISQFAADQRGLFWNDLFGLTNATVHSSNVDGRELTEDTLSINVDLTVPGYAVSAGRRLFLNPNMIQPSVPVPPEMTTSRSQPIEVFRYSHVDVDSIRIVLPEGVYVEVPLEDVSLELEGFGSYSTTMEVEDNILTYVRRIAIYESQNPAEDYRRIRNFLQAVNQADERQVSLVLGR